MLPLLRKGNWRQISVSICKQKLSAKDPAHFELKDVEAADVGEELDLVATAEQGNYSHVTFKQAYAGSATLNMNGIAYRNHRPSASCPDLSTFIEFYKGEFVSEHETEMHRAPFY